MDEETPSIPRYLGEGWRGSPRPSHNNEKQSMVFVKSSANDKSSPRLEDLSFADDLTNPIDCFSLLWDGRGDPLHPSPRQRGGWATGSRRDRRRPQETSAPVTRFEKKLPTAPLIARRTNHSVHRQAGTGWRHAPPRRQEPRTKPQENLQPWNGKRQHAPNYRCWPYNERARTVPSQSSTWHSCCLQRPSGISCRM